MMEQVLYVVFPYVATVVAVVGAIHRYRQHRYTYSSFSTQFLEGQVLRWGSVPWHYGIVLILLVHVVAAVLPGLWGSLLRSPLRLYVLEFSGWILASASLLGLTLLLARRSTSSRVLAVTTWRDFLVMGLLWLQVLMGLWIAVRYRWGGLWYVHSVVPWLASLARLHPDLSTLTPLPGLVKSHILVGFILVALFPYTKLVHFVTFPVSYLWRPYQLVIWNRRKRSPLNEPLSPRKGGNVA